MQAILPEPDHETVDLGLFAAGNHFHAPIDEVARVAGQAQRLGLGAASGPIEHALHPARNKGTLTNHAA